VGGLLTPAHVVDLAVAVVALELVGVALARGRAARGQLAGATAGLCLLLATRLALAGNGAGVMALVALGGFAHLADIALRRSPPRA
jgi:hypothetical protein